MTGWGWTALLSLLLGAIALGTGGLRSSAEIYSSLASPSGSTVAIKQYRGDEHISWDILLEPSRPVLERQSIAVLSNQPIRGGFGSDGVLMEWQDDHHLIIAWPRGQRPLSGPARVGDVDISYRSFEQDPDQVRAKSSKLVRLDHARIDFQEMDRPTGRRFTTTKRPIVNIRCMAKLSAYDPAQLRHITVDIIGNGTGLVGNLYPSVSMVGVRFKVSERDRPDRTLTQAKLDSAFPTFAWDKSPKQLNDSILYRQIQLPDVLSIFRALLAHRLDIKLVFGFDQKLVNYKIALKADADVPHIIRVFNKCAAQTDLYAGHLRIPIIYDVNRAE